MAPKGYIQLEVSMTVQVPETVEEPEEIVANDIRDMLNGDVNSAEFSAYDLAVVAIEARHV